MRVYAVADIHGRAWKMGAIRERVNALRPDALAVAGDVARLGKVAPVLEELNGLGVPVFAVW
ncbi:MAG: phosphoesterase, partial [Desulfobacterales bacterium]|nr:phosphoesterase [Desulfobacterales bacterium]